MKNFYPFQVTDLRFQVDQVNPENFQIFEHYIANPNQARLFNISVRHRKIEMISGGHKITENKVI